MKIIQAIIAATLMVSSSLAPSYGEVETPSRTQSDPNKPDDRDSDDIAVQIWKTDALIRIHQLEIDNLRVQLQILQDQAGAGADKGATKDKAEQ